MMEGVPRMPMLEIELKQNSFDYSALEWAGMPSEDVHEATQQQIVEGLKKHISEVYGDDPAKYKEAIEKFIELESAAYRAILSPDFEGCNTLKKYYGQLHYMQSRFPFTGDEAIKVTFAWQDAFTCMLTVHESFSFEQTAILFNIGAIHSTLGAMDNRTTEEGIRISCVHFQCAAGLFSYIAENFDTTMSADISQSMLKLFISIMLAQGQECLLEKSMQDNRKHSIVSKISQQVVDYYVKCLQSIENRDNETSLGSQAHKHWKRVVAFKIAYYSAITKYYMGNNSQEQDKYGQAVGQFGAAVAHLNEAAKLAKGIQKETRVKAEEAIKFTSDVLNGKYTSAVKDNEFVYHEKIPDRSNLPEIKGASLVKALPYEPANPAITGPDIFSKLVPLEAHLAASSYSEEKAKLLREVCEKVNAKDEILNQYKQSIELDPDKLIKLEESNKLDQALIEKCALLSVDQSPIDQLKSAMDELTDVYSELDTVLNDILGIVEDEELEDQKLKNKCGKDAFSSQDDVDGIKKELQVYKELYHKASQMNDDLHTASRIHVANMKLVAGGMDSVREELNYTDVAELISEDDKNVVQLIRKLCDKVVEMEDQRKALLKQLRQQMETDDVTSTLVTKHGVDQEDLFKEELKKHDSVLDTINKNLSAQDNILDAVTEANARYTKIRKTVETEKGRVDAKVNNLIMSCDCYEDVLRKCKEGKTFFAEVLDKSNELLKRSKEFHEENMEKRKKIYTKWEEKEIAKRPPPRPSAPKPKLGEKKKVLPAPAGVTTSTFLSPDVLAKMMAEDEDDELLNDPEFLQFLQAQGGIHSVAKVPPVMPGTAPLPRPFLPPGVPGGRLPARPHTMPVHSFQQPGPGHGAYPAVSSPAAVPGQMTHPGAPSSPHDAYAQPHLSMPQGVPGTHQQPTPSPAPTLAHRIQSSASGIIHQGNVLPFGASSAPAMAPPSQGVYGQGYVQQPQQIMTAGQGPNTVSMVGGPVPSLQDPRQMSRAIPPVSYEQPPHSTPPVSYTTSQPSIYHPAQRQQYYPANQTTYMQQMPPASPSPGPAVVPSSVHPPQVMSPQMAVQYSPNNSPAHHVTAPAHAMSPVPQMVGQFQGMRPQMVHHNYYVAPPVPGQRQQPVQVSQVAIVYSTPPPPQQSTTSTFSQPGTHTSSSPMVQQGFPPQIGNSNIPNPAGQHAIQGFAPSMAQPTFTQPPQPQYSAPYEQGPVSSPAPAGMYRTSVPTSVYQAPRNYPAPTSSPYQPHHGVQCGPQPGTGNMAYQGQFPPQQGIPNQQFQNMAATPTSNMPQYPAASQTYQPHPPQEPRPDLHMRHFPQATQAQQIQQPIQTYPMQREPVPQQHQNQYPPTPRMQQPPVAVRNTRYSAPLTYQAGQQVPPQQWQQEQSFIRAPSHGPNQQIPVSRYQQQANVQQQQPGSMGQAQQPRNFQLQQVPHPPMPGQPMMQGGNTQYGQLNSQSQGGGPLMPGQPPLRHSVPSRLEANQQFQQSFHNQQVRPQGQQVSMPPGPTDQQGQNVFRQPQQGYNQQASALQQIGTVQPGQDTARQQQGPTSQIGLARPVQSEPSQVNHGPVSQGSMPHVQPGQMPQSQQRPGPSMQNFAPLGRMPAPLNQSRDQPPQGYNQEANQSNTGLPAHGETEPQNYVFRSQPHPGQYFTTPSNESSPKHAPAQHGKQGSGGSVDSAVQTMAANFREPIGVLQPTPVNKPTKPEPAPNQPSSDLAGLILTPTRSLSTSADELLSTVPGTNTITAKDTNQIVLVPTKIDEDGEGMVVRPVEGLPYMDEADLMKFKSEVAEFRAKVHNLLHKPQSNGLCHLDREWKQLSETQEKFSRQLSTAVARCSSYKNRFQDIVPFDQSRVILQEAKDDYINASVIDGVSPFCPRFIATQSPLANTCSDFWLMVYEQQITLIVMLVNSKDVPKKCPIYWPADRAIPQQHGPLTVSFTTSKTHGDLYIERTFTIKHQKQSLALSVTQLQYIAWPEHRLPSSATDLLNFLHVVQSYHGSQRNLQWPALVHCESGVGRTGVFCAFMAGINEINAGMGIMDVVDIVNRMRKKRKYMVQEKAQLKFVYDVILYHAIDVLKQRKVVLEDEVKPASIPQQVHPPNPAPNAPGKFNIFANNAALSSIQATVEKMTVKPGMEKMQKDQDYPMPIAPSKSCGEVPHFSALASVEDPPRIDPRPYTSDQALYNRQSQPVHYPTSTSLGGISDLVQGTIPAPPSTADMPAPDDIDQTRVSQNSVKPDIVESCNSQVSEKRSGLESIQSTSQNGAVDPAPTTNGAKTSPSGPSPTIIDLMTPGGFTLDNPEDEARKARRVTKEDFFKPSVGLTTENDPTDPFSGLDPLWGHKK